MLAVALMASPVFAGGSGCCAKSASNDKAMCVDYASLNVSVDQKSKLETWAAECNKAGCTREPRQFPGTSEDDSFGRSIRQVERAVS